MGRVDFYVTAETSAEARLNIACRLAEKAWREGLRTWVSTSSQAEARQFDERLWIFRDGSFVPHAVAPVDPDDPSPVVIGWDAPPADFGANVLINLSEQVPDFADRFERVIEVLDQRPQCLESGRNRFRSYRERGLDPVTHRLE